MHFRKQIRHLRASLGAPDSVLPFQIYLLTGWVGESGSRANLDAVLHSTSPFGWSSGHSKSPASIVSHSVHARPDQTRCHTNTKRKDHRSLGHRQSLVPNAADRRLDSAGRRMVLTHFS